MVLRRSHASLLWMGSQAGHITAGAADGALKVWDKRKLDQAAFSFDVHSRALMRVEWASYGPGRHNKHSLLF